MTVDTVTRRVERFRAFAWGLLVYILLVILWGAYVRATGSGAGCGGSWPLCNGGVVPPSPDAAALIEYTHRLTSGLSLIAVGGLCAWAFRLFPRGHIVRRLAALSCLFLVIEALLGAGLVLLGYVAENSSAGRAAYLSAHFVNTQVLLSLIALTAWFARPGEPAKPHRPGNKLLVASLPVALALSVTGVIAALGDTLYPASSIAAGIAQELAPEAGALLRLRLLHPVMAAGAGTFLLLAALSVKPATGVSRFAVTLIFVQLAAGALNFYLLAPVWMQIVHLLLADLLWLALVFLVAESYRSRPPVTS
ncbi:MAG: heme A synthase [Acidobacteriales bacterium]|nr:MAG: heme A synthase [Terriglobales bacterium]